MNSMSRTLTFGPSLTSKMTLASFGPPGQFLDSRLDLGELVALLGHQTAQDPFDSTDCALVEERVQTKRDAGFLHLFVDFRPINRVGWHVFDDLDARAFLHVEDDVLACDPARSPGRGPQSASYPGSWWPTAA